MTGPSFVFIGLSFSFSSCSLQLSLLFLFFFAISSFVLFISSFHPSSPFFIPMDHQSNSSIVSFWWYSSLHPKGHFLFPFVSWFSPLLIALTFLKVQAIPTIAVRDESGMHLSLEAYFDWDNERVIEFRQTVWVNLLSLYDIRTVPPSSSFLRLLFPSFFLTSRFSPQERPLSRSSSLRILVAAVLFRSLWVAHYSWQIFISLWWIWEAKWRRAWSWREWERKSEYFSITVIEGKKEASNDNPSFWSFSLT